MKNIKLKIDNRSIEVQEGQTIFQAAVENGIPIPHMCFDPRLDPFTSCWLCTVEVKGFPRLVPSCTAKVAEGMEVFTQSERVVSARKTCLALLLSDHYGDCIAPCQVACPDHIDIQGYLALIALGKYQEALALIREVNPLPLSVGRVCPRFCEKECRRNLVDEPVGINFLKRFASEHGYEGIDPSESLPEDSGFRVAVIGAGPAGLTAAHFLRLKGHAVTIFEANHKPGGMMRYGIPEYRLPKKEMDKEIALISRMGVQIRYGVRFGKDADIKALRSQGFKAILLAIGAWAERNMGCEGEDLIGVESGIGLLYKIAAGEKVHIGKRVSVIGGGNTAIDAARSCLRMGAKEVHLIYRRSRDEMPANDEEVHEAELEGVKLHFLSAPVKILGCADEVNAVRCIKMRLGDLDASGRRRPVPVEGSEYEFRSDMVIAAIGQIMADQDALKEMGIDLTRRRTVAVDEKSLQTNLEGVFSAGDCVLGPATVIESIAGGRHAASAIDAYLRGSLSKQTEKGPYNHSKGDLSTIDRDPFESYERIPRAKMPALPKDTRLKGFEEVELGLTEEMARKEANRCLSCGCEAVFDRKLREYATEFAMAPTDVMSGKYNLYPERDEHAFIFRDRNKCIRCGLCVRICAEVEGASAYGFVGRGFQAIIDPPLELSLKESACDSCGLCTSTCPTGALEYRPALPKPGPWRPEETQTVCTLCGMGCQIIVKTRAGCCIEVTPQLEGSINQGKLCWRGTFGWEMIHSAKRPKGPSKKQGDGISQVSWEDAFAGAGRALNALISDHGVQSLAVLASPRLGMEEDFLIANLAKRLKTPELYKPGWGSQKGHIHPSVKYSEYAGLLTSDLILCLGSMIVEDYPVASYMIKDAVKRGSKLAIIGPDSGRLTDIAQVWIDAEPNELNFVLSLLSAFALDQGLISSATDYKEKGIQPVSSQDMERLNRMIRKGDAKALAKDLVLAKQRDVVVNRGMVSDASLAWFFEGIWDQPISFLPLSPYGQNIHNGESLSIDRLEKKIKDGKIKGILAFGHWKGLERIKQSYPDMLVIQTAIFRENHGYHPDFFFPASLPIESAGSFINSEGRTQRLSAALSPSSGLENWEVILRLAEVTGVSLGYKDLDAVRKEMSRKMDKSKKTETPEVLCKMADPGSTKKGSKKPEYLDWSVDEIDHYLKKQIAERIF